MDTASPRRIAPLVISSIVVLGFVVVLVLLILRPIDLNHETGGLLQILAGALSAQFVAVVQYYLGSSSGSKDKDELSKALILAKGPQSGPPPG